MTHATTQAMTARSKRLRGALAAIGVPLALASCQAGLEDPAGLPALDEAMFRCEVEPVLVARCSFYVCHGSGQRPFQVFAVNRLRLDPPRGELGYVLNQPLTPTEHEANFRMALGMAMADAETRAPLLTKPLATELGGQFHMGAELYGGGDVFTSVLDPGYLAIERWLAGETRDPECFPFEEVGP